MGCGGSKGDTGEAPPVASDPTIPEVSRRISRVEVTVLNAAGETRTYS